MWRRTFRRLKGIRPPQVEELFTDCGPRQKATTNRQRSQKNAGDKNMKDNPYFYWVLCTDIIIIVGVITYIVRDQMAKKREKRNVESTNKHDIQT
jgi:hypothetical protein